MKKLNSLAILALGAVGGIALVVACSDDSPTDADAAVCDCPAAEPPLTGRIVAVRQSNPIVPGSGGGAAVACPAGSTILGGACEVETPDARVLLMESRFFRTGNPQYVCQWSALDATAANTGTAEAICLTPAQ
jgi:hypothetical protein